MTMKHNNIIEKRIWKYELEVTDIQNISIPKGGEILTVQIQSGKPCLWVLVEPQSATEIRSFEIFGAGNPVLSDIGTSRKYISTFQLMEGSLVLHMFEYTGI